MHSYSLLGRAPSGRRPSLLPLLLLLIVSNGLWSPTHRMQCADLVCITFSPVLWGSLHHKGVLCPEGVPHDGGAGA